MILGRVAVIDGAVVTHNDTYLLKELSVVSVRRPLLAGCLMMGGGLLAFTAGFGDLLYAGEIGTLAVLGSGQVLIGWQLGQLKLLSRDLKGSELAGVIFGQYRHLNRIRHDIAASLHRQSRGGGT